MPSIIFWTIICAGCLIFEFITVGDLVSIWFSLGALITGIVSLFVDNITVHVAIFVCFSAISMLLLRPICLKALKRTGGKTNLEAIMDKTVKIIEPILSDKMGTAKLEGVIWNCVTSDGEEVASGTICKVVEIQGNKLIVKPTYEK